MACTNFFYSQVQISGFKFFYIVKTIFLYIQYIDNTSVLGKPRLGLIEIQNWQKAGVRVNVEMYIVSERLGAVRYVQAQ